MLDESVQTPKHVSKQQKVTKEESSKDKSDRVGDSGDGVVKDNIQAKSPEVKPYILSIPFLQRLRKKTNEGHY